MKITREGIEDIVWLTGLGCTAGGSWILGGPGIGLLTAGVVILGVGFAGAVLRHIRGKREP